jgi:hypothetical protein
MARPTFERAKAQYVHRYTMEHVPAWTAQINANNGKYYAPQFRTDREWYDNTVFPGEPGHSEYRIRKSEYCETRNQTWPLGQWLDRPYKKD